MLNHWSELEEACLSCRKCALCETRNHVVFGVGNQVLRGGSLGSKLTCTRN